MTIRHVLVLALVSLAPAALPAQSLTTGIAPHLLEKPWPAQWITHVACKAIPCPGVYVFRKDFDVPGVPARFVVHVSADNHYRLFLNGDPLGHGPVRGTPERWFFDSYDLAPRLRRGPNVLAAQVWHAGTGEMRPWGQLTVHMGLVVQGDDETASMVNTDGSWRVVQDRGFELRPQDRDFFPDLTGIGPSELVHAERRIWELSGTEFDDHGWLPAQTLGPAVPRGSGSARAWALAPRMIPAMEQTPGRLLRVSRARGVEAGAGFVAGEEPVIVAPNTRAEILLDRGHVETGYPEVTLSGGAGARLRLITNEGMYDARGRKTHRDRVEGLELIGLYDEYVADGARRTWRPLDYRTYRYLQIEVETADASLTLHDVEGVFTAYPFERRATFRSSDPALERIFDVGWRTARLCAHDTYVDFPYYERLQYFGDLAISNPVTAMLSGDARLMKQAIVQAHDSRSVTPLTACASPSKEKLKIIPFFSLAWIDMMATYLDLTGDAESLRPLADGAQGVLDWFGSRLDERGMLGPVPFWNFVDCTTAWPWAPDQGSICEAPGSVTGGSSILGLEYAYGLQRAAALFDGLGMPERAAEALQRSQGIVAATRTHSWDARRRLVADTPERASYSQHANIFAALVGLVRDDEARDLLDRVMQDPELIQASLQYRAYYHRALSRWGAAGDYVDRLGEWRHLLDRGFTTFPEYPNDTTRSDTHAWSSFPAYELLTIVCGIRPDAPGFDRVRIEPNLGSLEWVEGSLPLPKGTLSVRFDRASDGTLSGKVSLPPGVTGSFRHGDREQPLRPGEQALEQ